MKKFVVIRSKAVSVTKAVLLIVLTLLLAVTGFLAVRSLGEKETVAYAAEDGSPTAEQLSAIGYKIESGKYYIKALYSNLTITFDGAQKTFTLNDETPINILTQTVDGVEYHVYFWFSSIDQVIHLERENSDSSTYNGRSYSGGWSGSLTFATPQSLSSLRIDSAGRIYYPIKRHTDTTTTAYYLSENGLTADINSASSTTVSLSSATVSLPQTSYTYTGGAITPAPTVKIGDTTLTPGTDYTVSYTNNTNAGTATVTITGKGNYTGTASAQFTIAKADRTGVAVTADGGTAIDVFGSGATLSVTDASGQTLSAIYAADGSSVATVDGSTVTAVTSGNPGHRKAVLGTVNVTASVAADDNHNAVVQTVTFTTAVKNGFTVTADGVTTAYESLQDAVEAAAKAGNATVTVTGNPVINETVIIPAGANIAIKGESGATLTCAEGFTGNMFSVLSGAGLTVENLTVDGSNASDSLFNVAGTLTLDAGAVVQNGSAENGGAVYVEAGGSATIAGTLSGNVASSNGGAVYIESGATLEVADGADINSNKAGGCGGAIYMESDDASDGTAEVTKAQVTISGGKIVNNDAGGIGNGVYAGVSAGLAIAATAISGISDAIGLDCKTDGSGNTQYGQITITGSAENELSGKLTVEYSADLVTAIDNAAKEGTTENPAYISHEFIVSEKNADDASVFSSAALKNHCSVKNSGYTLFADSEHDATAGLTAGQSATEVAVYKNSQGEWVGCRTIQAAIDAVKAGNVQTIDGVATVYLLSYSNTKEEIATVEINEPLTIPKDCKITFASAVKKVEEDNVTYDYVTTDVKNTVLKRGESLTDEMIRVEEGATLTLANVTLDGGAVWGENGDESIQIADDGKGGAGTVATNNYGVTAHDPVIVNQGTLNITDGAIIQNNDNNYAAPGEGFGSQNYGGGVRNEGSGTLNMTGGTIQNCYSREGGAIMNVNKPVKFNEYTANSSADYYIYNSDGTTLTKLDTATYTVQKDGNGYAYVTVGGVTSYVYAGTGCTVNVSGGKITGNVSQQKGAAIQTIYGGAVTVVSGGEITGNRSLHDLGVLSVEEGGSLTVSGGTVTAVPDGATDQNAIYLFNQYSAEDYAGYATAPFIEGVNVGKLAISGSPTITGVVHLDDNCYVVDLHSETLAPSATYYMTSVDLTNYTGNSINVAVSDGYNGEVAISTASDSGTELLDKVTVVTDGEDGDLSGQITYVKEENGSYILYTGAYNLTFTQTEPGKLTITGTVDPSMQSVKITIDGNEYILSAEQGVTDGNTIYGAIDQYGNVYGIVDLSNLTADGAPATVVIAAVTFGYAGVEDVKYIGADGTSATNGLTETLCLVQLDSATAVITVPDSPGIYYMTESGEYKKLESGILPNDIAIDENGYAKFTIGGELKEDGTVTGGDEREIRIGARAGEPSSAGVAGGVYDADNDSITITAKDGFEYALAVATGDGGYELTDVQWATCTDGSHHITFTGLNAETAYVVIVRTPAQTDGGETVLPSKYVVSGDECSPLTSEDATSKENFKNSYEGLSDSPSEDEIKGLLDSYKELSSAVRNLPSVKEMYDSLLALYADIINEQIDAELAKYADAETQTVRSELSTLADSYKTLVNGASDADGMDDILWKAEAALALADDYYKLTDECVAEMSESGLSSVKNIYNKALAAIDGATAGDDLDAIVDNAEKEMSVAADGEKFLDAHSVLRKEFADISSGDGDALAAALGEIDGLSQDVSDYLNEAARTLNKAEENWYSSFASFIRDEIKKSEFEQEKEQIVSDTEQIVNENDGERVLDVLEEQRALINSVAYEPCKDDDNRDDYAQGKSDELNAAGATAKIKIEHAQAQQSTINSAIEKLKDMIADNRYNDTQKEKLQEIIDTLETDVYGVSSSGDDDQSAQEKLAELLAAAIDELGTVNVSSVITGDIKISDNGALTTSDGTGDYGENNAEEKVWGVVTNDSSIPSDVLLVIEKTNGDAMKAIDDAADSGNLVVAEADEGQLDANSLTDLVSGKEIKATLDIYLLKENARYEQFEGIYVVKVLMPSEWRNYQGLQVVYVGDDGNVQVYKTDVKDGKYLVFSTVHFSEFYILGEKEVNLWWLIVTLSVVLAIELIAIVAVLIKRKKQDGGKEEKAAAFVPVGSLLAVTVPNGAVTACIVLGVCVVAAGAALAVLALKKKRVKQEAAECASGGIPTEGEQNGGICFPEAAVAAAEAVYNPAARRYIVIKYSKSFSAKLIQADDRTKGYYTVLKNEIMSYGAKSRVSWRHESFRYGKTLLIKMAMRGKTLCLCFALSASNYAGSKYKTEDCSETATLQVTPCLYRIKNDRRCKYAKELIADVMKKYGLERAEEQNVAYAAALPYEDTDALVARGLVKVLTDEEAQSGTQFRPVEVRREVKASEVDAILSDAIAEKLVGNAARYADKTKAGIINVDTISRFFTDGETVTLEEIKKRVPGFSGKITYVKVLARGTLNKTLTVVADDFSIEAVKMILLTGGKVKRTLIKGK